MPSASLEASLRLEIAEYQAALAKAQGSLVKFKENAKKTGKGLGNDLFGGLNKFIAGGAIVYAGKQALGAVVGFDRLERGMTTLEGSAGAAGIRLDELREAARLPGLDFEQAVRGDIRLRSVGISAELSKKAMIEMGNALSLAGGTAADLDGVILALTQIASKGKVSAEEINQIAERVPQVRAVMMDLFGTADTEAIQKMGISAQDFITQLISGFSKLDRATAGLDEDLTDIASSLNMAIVEVAGPLVKDLVPAFRELATTIADNKTAIADFGSYAASSINGLISDAGRMVGVMRELGVAIGVADPLKATTGRGGGGGGFTRNTSKGKSAILANPTQAAKAASKPLTPVDFDKIATAQLRLEKQKRDAALEQMTLGQKIGTIQAELTNAIAEEAALRADFAPDAERIIAAESRKVELQSELVRLQKQSADEAARAAKTAEDEAKSKRDSLMSLSAEMKDLELRAAGRDREADVIREAERIEKQAGVDQMTALRIAERMIALKEKGSALDRGERAEGERKKIISRRDGSTLPKQSGRFGNLDDYYRLQQKREVPLDERFATQKARGGGAGLPIGQGSSLVPQFNDSLAGRTAANRAAMAQDLGEKSSPKNKTDEQILQVLIKGLLGQ